MLFRENADDFFTAPLSDVDYCALSIQPHNTEKKEIKKQTLRNIFKW